MTTARRKSSPVAPGVEAARPDAGDNRPGASHHPPPTAVAPPPALAPHNNLSLPRSPLLGRDHDIAVIQQLLLQEQVGLLTLTGPGGIGKTRLALQVAANLLDHFVDGVYFVALAPISDPNLVSATIAQTLGVREAAGRPLQESLQDYLRDKQLLLVLDNFEQILPAASLVSTLLTACLRLKVLVTSRATLHLYGEQEFPVPPLALPDAKDHTTASLSEFATIELFCQRAKAVKPDFALTAENDTTIAQICIRLDGLPLAIELAAARLQLFSPAALLRGLEQRLPLLTGGPHDLPTRQRTLRDEIAWSYDLLTADEQKLFRRLAVFVGGFTFAAAWAVGNAAGDLQINVLDGVASLRDKNLLRQAEGWDDEARFGMLETIHECGLEQLQASGEAEMIRRSHANCFLTLAEEADPHLRGPEQMIWLQRLDADDANFQAALAWSLRAEGEIDSRDREQGVRLAGALSWFWLKRARFSESRVWCEQAVTLSGTAESGPARARALQGAGIAAQMQGDFIHAQVRLEESLALWQDLEERPAITFTLSWLACAVGMLGDLATERSLIEASLALSREIGATWEIAFALHLLGVVHKDMGDYATAHPLIEESLRLFQALGDAWGITDVLSSLIETAFHQGDYTAARTWLEEALPIGERVKDKWFLQNAYFFLGDLARRQDYAEQAVAFFEQSLTLAHAVGNRWGIPGACLQIGFIRQRQGDDQQATIYFRQSLQNLALIQAPRLQDMILALTGLSAVAAHQQQWERAAQLCGAVETLCATLNRPFTTLQAADYIHSLAPVRAKRKEPPLAAAWTQGEAMTLEEVVAYALTSSSVPGASSVVPSTPLLPLPQTYPAGLTAREVEVLRLLAQRRTYAEIADQLVISRRTVNTHITSIYGKLGITGREAATRFALDHHLL